MKQTLYLFYMVLKAQLKRPAYIFLLILIPCSMWFFSNFHIFNDSIEISAGICLSGENEMNSMLLSKLTDGDFIVNYIAYDSVDNMKRDVLNKTLSCAYVIPDNLENLMDNDTAEKSIQLITGSQNALVYSLSNEIFFSQLIKIYGRNILLDFIQTDDLMNQHTGILAESDNSPEAIINDYYDYYLDSDSTFHVVFEVLSDTDEDAISDTKTIQASSSVFPVRGIFAILVFAAGLFGSMQYLIDKKKHTFSIMNKRLKICSALFYPFIYTALTGISCLIALYASHTVYPGDGTFFRMAVYIIITTLYCMVLSAIIRNSSLMAGAIPVLIIMSLVICPVFVNLAPLIPAVKILRHLFPVGYFL